MRVLAGVLRVVTCCTAILILVVVLAPCVSHSLAVMSIDFGYEWIKIGVVSPGVPLDIALNRESKRKTPTVISVRDGVRLYGEEAAATAVRFPSLGYSHLSGLLGRHVQSPVVARYRSMFPQHEIVEDPLRNTVAFQQPDGSQLSVEQLVSMMLRDAREVASSHTGQAVTDAVITVPAHWSQAQRRAILSAAQLAGIKTLQLINNNAAVALNYGMFRRADFNSSAYYILFLDSGAGGTSASLVSYQLVKSKERGVIETNPQLQVLAYSYDETLGGSEMTRRLRDHLAQQFSKNKKTTLHVQTDRRAMAKLWREAERVKRILSANAETYAQVEGLLDDEDFRELVKREQFERLCDDLLPRVWKLVESTVSSAGLKADNLDQLMLVGGSSRVPWLQQQLERGWEGRELSRSINADEAAALGAVYRAAELSTGFRVKKFHVRDHVLLPVVVDFEREVEIEGKRERRLVRRNLFSLGNPYPQKKVITFNKNTQDFGFTVNYGDLSHLSDEQVSDVGGLNLSYVLLSGVGEAFATHSEADAQFRGVKVHFHMDDSGLLNLSSVEALFDVPDSADSDGDQSTLAKLGSAFSKMFSSTDGDDEKSADTMSGEDNSTSSSSSSQETASSSPNSDHTTTTTSSTTTTTTTTVESGNNTTAVKTRTEKVAVKFTQTNLNIADISEESLQAAQDKLSAMDEQDRQRARRERSRNALESFVNEAQARMYEPSYEAASSEQERAAISSAAAQMGEWLYEEGFDETAAVFEQKLDELKKLTESLYDRVEEHASRREAVHALNNVLNVTQHFLASANQSVSEGVIKQNDVTPLAKMLTSTQEWLKMKLAEQEKTPLSQTPKLRMSALVEKYSSLDREVKYLMNKIKVGEAQKLRDDASKKLQEQLDKLKLQDNITLSSANISDSETMSSDSTDDSSESPQQSSSSTDDSTSATAESDNTPDDGHSEL